MTALERRYFANGKLNEGIWPWGFVQDQGASSAVREERCDNTSLACGFRFALCDFLLQPNRPSLHSLRGQGTAVSQYAEGGATSDNEQD